ncbi:MAG: diguanylate cyclase domain-containing protein [Deefgea sp.]
MPWRFWRHKDQSSLQSSASKADTTFATIFPHSAGLSSRIQAKTTEERRSFVQMLAILQCVLALLMPMVLHFSGVEMPLLMSFPILLAFIFATCAWQLRSTKPFFIILMVVLNVLVVPVALFSWLAWSTFAPLSLLFPFLLQMMILLVLSMKPRDFALALWLCASLALICILSSGGKSLDQAAAILALSITVPVVLLIAQRLASQQIRLGAIKQHVRNDSEKMAVRAEKMRRLALSDGLTGLSNRLSLMNKLQRLLAEPERARHSVLYLIDLDFFKTVNDQFGHAAGDAVLIECGQRFKSVVRRGDVVCRLGGDEFVIVVQGLVGINQAQLVAQKILHKLTEPLLFEGQVMPLGGSIGVALWHSFVTNPDEWLSEADAAMYQAKSAGRNQFYVSRVAV